MIYSILDTDLYKFTTSYAYIKLFPYASGTFSFTDRDQTVCSDHFLAELKEAIDQMRRIALTGDDMDMLARELCAILQHTVRMHILAGHIDRMLSSVLRMS